MNKLEKFLAQSVTPEMDRIHYRPEDYDNHGYNSDLVRLTSGVKNYGFKITGDTKANYKEDKNE